MRRSWAVLVTAAVILPLAAAGATSIASAASNQPHVATAGAFTVLAHATNFKMINVDGKGIGAGDYVVERWVLRHAGARAGGLNDQCTINFNQAPSHPAALAGSRSPSAARVRSPRMARWCSLRRLRASGRSRSTFRSPAGTGSYQNADGQIHVEFVGVADARFTFHLTA